MLPVVLKLGVWLSTNRRLRCIVTAMGVGCNALFSQKPLELASTFNHLTAEHQRGQAFPQRHTASLLQSGMAAR